MSYVTNVCILKTFHEKFQFNLKSLNFDFYNNDKPSVILLQTIL